MHSIKLMGLQRRDGATIFCSLFPGGHLIWTLDIKSFHQLIHLSLLRHRALMAGSRLARLADTSIHQAEYMRGHLSLLVVHLTHFATMEPSTRPFLLLWHPREVDRLQIQAMERLGGRLTRGAVELSQQLVPMMTSLLRFNRGVHPVDQLRH